MVPDLTKLLGYMGTKPEGDWEGMALCDKQRCGGNSGEALGDLP
jgi:hypothetical protein